MLPDLEIAVRLLVAATLGSLIGFERERLLWQPGFGLTCLFASVLALS